MNWIVVNIPWNKEAPPPTSKSYPNLDNEIREQFGYTNNDLLVKYFNTLDSFYDSIVWKNFEKEESRLHEELNFDSAATELALEKSDNIDVKAVLEYRKKNNEIKNWYYNHPSVIAVQEENDIAYKKYKENAQSFCGKLLNNSGTLIQFKNSEGEISQYLIGDINTNGGVCDDCVGIERDDIVIAYAVLDILNK